MVPVFLVKIMLIDLKIVEHQEFFSVFSVDLT